MKGDSMKKDSVIASKESLVFGILGGVVCAVLLAGCIMLVADWAWNVESVVTFLIVFSIIVYFTVLDFLFLNRMACIVYLEDGCIKRKGLFFGFRRECETKNVLQVREMYLYRNGNYLFLVDPQNGKLDCFSSKAYICFRDTKETRAFLRRFWSGRIRKE